MNITWVLIPKDPRIDGSNPNQSIWKTQQLQTYSFNRWGSFCRFFPPLGCVYFILSIKASLAIPTNYEKGRSFEYRVKKYYENLGYDVHRKYASKGVMDLICIRSMGSYSLVLYIQCKTNGKISNDECVALINHSEKYGAHPVIAYKDKKRHVACVSAYSKIMNK